MKKNNLWILCVLGVLLIVIGWYQGDPTIHISEIGVLYMVIGFVGFEIVKALKEK